MTIKKAIMKSVSKTPEKNKYTFIKDKSIAEIFYNVFKELQLSNYMWEEGFMVTERYYHDHTGERFIDVTTLEDWDYSISDDKYDIEIFVGSKMVFLIIRTKLDLQQEIGEIIFKYFKMAGDSL